MKEHAFIVDIDGTLANCEPRRARALAGGRMDWRLWNAEMGSDTPNEWCVELIRCMVAQGYLPIFVTGRHEEHMAVTSQWLAKYLPPATQYELFMRDDADFRKDDIVKEEIYRAHIEKSYHVLFVVDDRKRVVDMWRRIGLTCLQCAEGDF